MSLSNVLDEDGVDLSLASEGFGTLSDVSVMVWAVVLVGSSGSDSRLVTLEGMAPAECGELEHG